MCGPILQSNMLEWNLIWSTKSFPLLLLSCQLTYVLREISFVDHSNFTQNVDPNLYRFSLFSLGNADMRRLQTYFSSLGSCPKGGTPIMKGGLSQFQIVLHCDIQKTSPAAGMCPKLLRNFLRSGYEFPNFKFPIFSSMVMKIIHRQQTVRT